MQELPLAEFLGWCWWPLPLCHKNKFVAITSKVASFLLQHHTTMRRGSTVKRTMVCDRSPVGIKPSAKFATHAKRNDGRLEGNVILLTSYHLNYNVHEERTFRVAYVTLSSHLNRNQANLASVIASGVVGPDSTTENGFQLFFRTFPSSVCRVVFDCKILATTDHTQKTTEKANLPIFSVLF